MQTIPHTFTNKTAKAARTLKLMKAVRRAHARWENAFFAKNETLCAIRFDPSTFAVAAARASDTFRLYNCLESALAQANHNSIAELR